MAVVSAIASVLSVALSTAFTVSGMADSKAAAAAQEAELERQKADAARDAAVAAKRAQGKARATTGKAGFFMSGTPLDLLGEMEATELENLSRINRGFSNQIDTVRAKADAVQGQQIGSIIGDAGRGIQSGISLYTAATTPDTGGGGSNVRPATDYKYVGNIG